MQVLGILHDVTELQRLHAEAKGQEEEFRLLREIIQTPKASLRDFLGKQSRLLNQIREELGQGLSMQTLKTVSARLHSMKGNARQLHLADLSQLCHATEGPLHLMFRPNSVLSAEPVLAGIDVLIAKIQQYDAVFNHFFGETFHEGSIGMFTDSEIVQIENWLEKSADLDPAIQQTLQSKIGTNLIKLIEDMGREQVKQARALGKLEPELVVNHQGQCRCSPEFKDVLLDARVLSATIRDLS